MHIFKKWQRYLIVIFIQNKENGSETEFIFKIVIVKEAEILKLLVMKQWLCNRNRINPQLTSKDGFCFTVKALICFTVKALKSNLAGMLLLHVISYWLNHIHWPRYLILHFKEEKCRVNFSYRVWIPSGWILLSSSTIFCFHIGRIIYMQFLNMFEDRLMWPAITKWV